MKSALLVLCPAEPGWLPADARGFEQILESIQLIGEPLSGDHEYLAGDRFLDLIAFMGCSPDINLHPGENQQQFCYIRLLSNPQSTEFHSCEHTHAPRCPHCSAAVADWRKRIGQRPDMSDEACWRCDACGQISAPWRYNWRKSAGFGRCFIEINNVYPREALPQQQLLDTLNSHYGVKWDYFYQY